MSIILFRYKTICFKNLQCNIYVLFFFFNLVTDLQNSIHFITGLLLYKLKLTAARLKKGTAQWFRLANSARIFINLRLATSVKSHAQKVRFGKKNWRFGSVRVRQKNSWFGRFLIGIVIESVFVLSVRRALRTLLFFMFLLSFKWSNLLFVSQIIYSGLIRNSLRFSN